MPEDRSKEIWTIGLPGGPGGPFYSLVNNRGNMIALQIPDRDYAELLRTIPRLHKAAKLARKLHNEIVDRYGDPSAIRDDMAALDAVLSQLGFD